MTAGIFWTRAMSVCIQSERIACRPHIEHELVATCGVAWCRPSVIDVQCDTLYRMYCLLIPVSLLAMYALEYCLTEARPRVGGGGWRVWPTPTVLYCYSWNLHTVDQTNWGAPYIATSLYALIIGPVMWQWSFLFVIQSWASLIGTLKNMVSKVAIDHPKSWHQHLGYVLWDFRECPNKSTYMATWTLAFGRA